MAAPLGSRLAEMAEGRAVVRARPQHAFVNPHGRMHGGSASTVLDSALGCAVHSTLAPGERVATLELTVNLVRAVLPETGELLAVDTIRARGRARGGRGRPARCGRATARAASSRTAHPPASPSRPPGKGQAVAAARRGAGASRIGQWTSAAKMPRATPIHHNPS